MQRLTFPVYLLLLVCAVAVLTGCASTDPDVQSDIPWNAPQPWEGAPGIPGFEGR